MRIPRGFPPPPLLIMHARGPLLPPRACVMERQRGGARNFIPPVARSADACPPALAHCAVVRVVAVGAK